MADTTTAAENQPVVLVAEDEMIVAFDLCETVEVAGFHPDGPHESVSEAIAATQSRKPDVALLDVNLDDGEVYPLADKLTEAGIPLIFHSGHAAPKDLVERYPDAAICQKPCPPDRLIHLLTEAA